MTPGGYAQHIAEADAEAGMTGRGDVGFPMIFVFLWPPNSPTLQLSNQPTLTGNGDAEDLDRVVFSNNKHKARCNTALLSAIHAGAFVCVCVRACVRV